MPSISPVFNHSQITRMILRLSSMYRTLGGYELLEMMNHEIVTLPASGSEHPNPEPAPRPRLSRAEQSRINGAKSRGPITPRGKGVSSMNGVKHGRRMKNPIPIFIEDSTVYPSFLDAYIERLRPADPLEHQLVSEIASVDWRLNRLLAFESRMIDTQFRLEQTPEEIQQFLLSQAVAGYKKLVDTSNLPEHLTRYQESLVRTRRALYDTLDLLRKSHPRHVRTQIPNIHNDIDPETEPLPNPDNPRPNPPSGTTEPEISAPEDLAA